MFARSSAALCRAKSAPGCADLLYSLRGRMQRGGVVFVASLAAGLVFSSIANLVLMQRYHQLNAQLRAFEEVPRGAQLPPLRGTGLGDLPLAYDPQQAKRGAVLFVYSTHCGPSNRNWRVWGQLMTEIASENRDLVLVDLGGDTDQLFVQRHRLQGYPVFKRVTAESELAYRLSVTPQTILLNSRGFVQHVWTGPMSAADAQEFNSMIKA